MNGDLTSPSTATQKGLMLPPGMALLAVSEKALPANQSAKCGRSFWDWRAVVESNVNGHFPYTPATSLLLGLSESLKMLFEEGLDNVFAAMRGWPKPAAEPLKRRVLSCSRKMPRNIPIR